MARKKQLVTSQAKVLNRRKSSLTREFNAIKLQNCKTLDDIHEWFLSTMLWNINDMDALRTLLDSYLKAVSEAGLDIGWEYYGGDPSKTAGAMTGQQSTVEGTIIEHYTNSVDAIKQRILLELGIDYKDKSDTRVPRTSEEFFKISEVSQMDLNGNMIGIYTDNVPLSNRINMILRDKGIGQNPEDMRHTLLSVSQGNKAGLGFCQGRFNQGSCGIFKFCDYKLIITRRALSLSDSTGKYGWTLLRKKEIENISEEHESWVYLTLNGHIPTLSGKTLSFLYGSLGNDFEDGTVIKVFNLERPRGLTSKSCKEYVYEFNSSLIDPLLSAELIHIPEGLTTECRRYCCGRLALVDSYVNSDNIEKSSPIMAHEVIHVRLDNFSDPVNKIKPGSLSFDIIFTAFQQDFSIAKSIINKKCITFSKDGQVQYYITPSLVASKVTIPGITRVLDYCMWDVKMDKIPPFLRDDNFFKGDRENCFNGVFAKAVFDKVYEVLNTSTTLRTIISNYTVKNSCTAIMDRLLKEAKTNEEVKRVIKRHFRFYDGDYSSLGLPSISKGTGFYGPLPQGTKVYNKKNVEGEIEINAGRWLAFMTGLTYKDLLDLDDEDIKIEIGKYDLSGDIFKNLSKKPTITGLVKYDSLPDIQLNWAKTSDKDEKIHGTNQGVIKVTLTPNRKIIKENDVYFIHCSIKNKDKHINYSGTMTLITHERTENPNRKGNPFGRIPYAQLEEGLPNIVLVSRLGNNSKGVLSYKDAEGKGIDKVNDLLNVKIESMGTKLHSIWFNLDSIEYNNMLSRRKDLKGEEALEKLYLYVLEGFGDNQEDLINKLKQENSLESNHSLDLNETHLKTLEDMTRSLESSVRSFLKHS